MQAPAETLVRRAVSSSLAVFGVIGVVVVVLSILVRVHITVEADGFLRPVRIWPVRSQVAGLVSQVMVSTGDTVRQGEVLIQLDSLELSAELAQVRSEYAGLMFAYERARAALPIDGRQKLSALFSAEARQVHARASLRDQLAGLGLGGGRDLDSLVRSYSIGTYVVVDRAVADLLAARADSSGAAADLQLAGLNSLELRRQRAELDQRVSRMRMLETQRQRLSVRAPAIGVISTERLERLLGAAVREGDLLLEISDPESWRVELYVSQLDVHEVKVGAPAEIEILAFRRTERHLLRGHVASIAVEPGTGVDRAAGESTTTSSRLYRVSVQIDELGAGHLSIDALRTGYTVRGRVVTGAGPIVSVLGRYLRRSF